MTDDILVQKIKNLISDVVADFLYYDRKEDDELPVGKIEELIEQGELEVWEIVETFKQELEEGLRND